MTADKDKYAVVVDGDVVDTVPTKKAAKEVLDTVPETADTEVRPLKEDDVVVKKSTGIKHIR